MYAPYEDWKSPTALDEHHLYLIKPEHADENLFKADWEKSGGGSFKILPMGGPDRAPFDWIIEAKDDGNGLGVIQWVGLEALSGGVKQKNNAEFANFELSLEWKAFLGDGLDANSGIFLRSIDKDPEQKGAIEIQIDDSGKDSTTEPSVYGQAKYKTGAIYEIAPANCMPGKVASPEDSPGAWNEFRITVSGKDASVTVELNKILVSEAKNISGKNPTGLIGLQAHTGKVHFRHIRVRYLSE